jgi:hypothetical protein
MVTVVFPQPLPVPPMSILAMAGYLRPVKSKNAVYPPHSLKARFETGTALFQTYMRFGVRKAAYAW